jgi:flagellar assembly protein FliH
MLCRIAEQPASAKPVVWRQLPANAARLDEVAPAAEASPAEVTQLKERIAELQQRLATESAQTRQEAFEEGLRQGREAAAVDMKAAAERLAKTLADLVAFKRKVRTDAEMELLNLSLAIARRILHRELLTDPEAMQGLVHAALQKIQNREIWRVRVFPGATEAVRSSLERMGSAAVEIVADGALKNGDLVIETAVGELDASVDSQLQEIQRGFADRLALR